MGIICRLFEHKYGENDICTRCGTSRGSKGLKYRKTADKKSYAVVGAGKCRDEIVSIPRFYQNKPVTEIGAGAFSGYDISCDVILPPSITKIGRAAFRRSALRHIHFSDTPCALGEAVFAGCTQLQEATLPLGITAIPDSAYSGCTALTEVALPESVTAIGNHAFSLCASLRHITYSDAMLSLSAFAFRGCTALETIRLPKGMTTLPAYLLTGCETLRSLDIPESITAVGEYALAGCLNLAAIVLPDGVTSVGSGAFCDCACITSFRFPASLTDFVPNANGDGDVFRGCTALREIHMHTNFKHFPTGMFADCSSLTDIYLDNGKSPDWRDIRKDADFDSGSGTYIVHLVNGRIRKGS